MICHHQPVYPSLFLCSALLAAGAPKPAIYLLRSLVSCVCSPAHVHAISLHVKSSKSPFPDYCIFQVHFHACASCRPPAIHVLSVPMSRSAVTLSRRVSASAASASPSPSSQSRCCQYAPTARRLAQRQCHHTRCCTSTHTYTSTLALLQLQLSILCVAESRQDDREARRCEAVNCEAAALLVMYALENPHD